MKFFDDIFYIPSKAQIMGQLIWFAWWHQGKVFDVKHFAWRLQSSGQGKCFTIYVKHFSLMLSKVFDVKYAPWRQAGKKCLELSNSSRNWKKKLVGLTSNTLLEMIVNVKQSVWRQTLFLDAIKQTRWVGPIFFIRGRAHFVIW